MNNPSPSSARPDKLSLILHSGDFDKLHYGLVVASGAAAVGTPVTLFFTTWACKALAADDGHGRPGWHDLSVSQTWETAAHMDADFAKRGLATFEELLEACVAMGVAFQVCEMGLKAVDLTAEDLRDDVPLQQGGVVTFLNDASRDGAMLFI